MTHTTQHKALQSEGKGLGCGFAAKKRATTTAVFLYFVCCACIGHKVYTPVCGCVCLWVPGTVYVCVSVSLVTCGCGQDCGCFWLACSQGRMTTACCMAHGKNAPKPSRTNTQQQLAAYLAPGCCRRTCFLLKGTII